LKNTELDPNSTSDVRSPNPRLKYTNKKNILLTTWDYHELGYLNAADAKSTHMQKLPGK
jgi:hypothetical protein